jgi:hypothetical protein
VAGATNQSLQPDPADFPSPFSPTAADIDVEDGARTGNHALRLVLPAEPTNARIQEHVCRMIVALEMGGEQERRSCEKRFFS